MSRRLLVLSFLLTTTVATFAEDQRVGTFGDPKQWHIHGLQLLDSGQVLTQLSGDFSVLLAAHPQARLAELRAVLEKRLLLGLRHSGFRDAHVVVHVNRDEKSVNFQVNESERFRSGQVLVKGIEGALADRIVTALVGKKLELVRGSSDADRDGNVLKWAEVDGEEPDNKKTLWKTGQPAPFDDVTLLGFQQLVWQVLDDAGYNAAKFEVSPVQRGQLVDLVVRVAELGPPSELREIAVDGNERNTDEEIVKFLGVRIGETITRGRRVELTRMLWESGRFIDQETNVKSSEIGATLQITVVETPDVPRLTENLPPQTLALLKCRNWITNGGGRHRDLVITDGEGTGSWEIIASRDGLLLAMNGDGEQDGLPKYAAIFRSDGISWYEIAKQRKLLSVTSALLLKLEYRLSPPNDSDLLKLEYRLSPPNDSDSRYSAILGFGFELGGDSMEEAPLRVRALLDPSYFVALGGNPDVAAKWDGELLTLKSPSFGSIRINAESGEFLGYEESDFRVNLVANQFKTRRDRIVVGTIDHRDHFDPALPLSSALGFIANSTFVLEFCEHLDLTETGPLAIQRLVKLMADCGMLQSLDRAFPVRSARSADQPEFELPSSGELADHWQRFARSTIPYADALFQRGSWPSTFWREVAFYYADQGHYWKIEVKGMTESGKMGPIGYWLLSELCPSSDPNPWTSGIIQQGLGKLDRASFRADCELLLIKSWPAVIRAVRWLDRLSDAELDAVAKIFLADRATVLQIRNSIGAASDEEAPAAILSALEQLWLTRWSRQVEARMRAVIVAQEATAQATTDKEPVR